MDPVVKEVMKEVGAINRKGVFDDQATVEIVEDNARQVRVTLTPRAGLFAGATIPFVLEFPDDYPASAPNPTCERSLYHSNITDSVCLNMFSEPDPNYRLEQYVNGLLWLLDNQNFDSALNGYVVPGARYPLSLRIACLGGTVQGETFSRLYDDEALFEARRGATLKALVLASTLFHPKRQRKPKQPRDRQQPQQQAEPQPEQPQPEQPQPEQLQPAQPQPAQKEQRDPTCAELLAALEALSSDWSEFFQEQLPVFVRLGAAPLRWKSGSATTVVGVARRLGVDPSAVLKPLLMRGEGGERFMVITSGTREVDLGTFAAALGGGALEVERNPRFSESNPLRNPRLKDLRAVYVDREIATSTGEGFWVSPGLPSLFTRVTFQELSGLLSCPLTVCDVPRRQEAEAAPQPAAPAPAQPQQQAAEEAPRPQEDAAVGQRETSREGGRKAKKDRAVAGAPLALDPPQQTAAVVPT